MTGGHPQDLALRDQVELDPVELIEATLARIEERDTDLRSFAVTFPEEARAMASRRVTGPLRGVPLGVKDMFSLPWRGYHNGSSRPLAPPSASGMFRRLDDAGAVVAGVTNQHFLGMGTTGIASAYGPGANPWSLAHCPGGSSGGSAAAVAARLVAGSIGSDSGGSTRLPAAYCGVLGLKLTFRSMPYDGYTGAATTLSAPGTFARDSDDLRLLTSAVLARPLPRADGSALRVGLVPAPFWTDLDPAVELACRAAVTDAGWVTTDLVLDGADLIAIAATIRVMTELGGAAPPELLAEADPMTRALMRYSVTMPARLVVHADRVRAMGRRGLAAAFESVDVVAWPTVPAPAPRVDHPWVDLPSGPALADIANMRQTVIANLAGVPGISIPVGLHPGGLPVGLQLLAPWGGEATLLDAAAHLEDVTGRRHVDIAPQSIGGGRP